MTITLHPKTELLRTMLEEQLGAHTNQLAELTAHNRSGPDGYDPDTLNALIALALRLNVRAGVCPSVEGLSWDGHLITL